MDTLDYGPTPQDCPWKYSHEQINKACGENHKPSKPKQRAEE